MLKVPAGTGRRAGSGPARIRLRRRTAPTEPRRRTAGRREDGGARRWWGVRACGAACLVPAPCVGPLAPAPCRRLRRTRPGGRLGRRRVAVPLPPGLTAAEHAALERRAPRAHPVRLLILGDSIALTLGMGLSVDSQAAVRGAVDRRRHPRVRPRPAAQVVHRGAPGPATPGCDDWRGLWPFLVAGQRPTGGRPRPGPLGDRRTTCSTGGGCTSASRPGTTHLTADLQSAITILHSFGAKVVLFTMPYVDPSDRQPDGQPWPENTPARVRAYNALVRQVARTRPGRGQRDRPQPDAEPRRGLHAHPCRRGRTCAPPTASTSALAGGELLQRQILPVVDRIGMEDEAAARAQA